jgi:hypothetical protein
VKLLTISPALFLWLALSRARLSPFSISGGGILRLSPPPLADYPFAVCCKFAGICRYLSKMSKRLNYRRARGNTVTAAIGTPRNGNPMEWKFLADHDRESG